MYLCLAEADPLRSFLSNKVPGEITSKAVLQYEDNIFYSKVTFIPCYCIHYRPDTKRFKPQVYDLFTIRHDIDLQEEPAS